jgi:hypothetical protein
MRRYKAPKMEMPDTGYSGIGNRSDEDLVEGYLTQLKRSMGDAFGVSLLNCERVRSAGNLHSEFDASANRVIIWIPAGQSEW